MYSHPHRQYELPRTNNFHVTLPHGVPYRLNASDYVFFDYNPSFPAHMYRVIVESMSNASSHPNDRFRDIGPLGPKIELPDVYYSQGFGSHASVLVLPIMEGYDKFIGNLIRGATYNIDLNGNQITVEGHKGMRRTGGFR